MHKYIPLDVTAALLLSGRVSASASVTDFATDGSCGGAEVTVNFAGLGQDASSCVSVAGVPSKNQQIVAAGSKPYAETFEELPTAFAYWGFYFRAAETSDWAELSTRGVTK